MFEKLIKVNIPLTEKDYRTGNGEGVWVEVDPETKAVHDRDEFGSGFHGILRNDSIYYPGLMCGDKIEFELRGENRPVVTWTFLEGRPRMTLEEKALLIEALAMKGQVIR